MTLEESQGPLVSGQKPQPDDDHRSQKVIFSPGAWLEKLAIPWLKDAPMPICQAFDKDNPDGQRLVGKLKRQWVKHCITTSLPFLALALIAPRFPAATAPLTADVGGIAGRIALALPHVIAYGAALGVTQAMTHVRFRSICNLAKHAARHVVKEAERVRFLPRADRQLSAEQLAELKNAGIETYNAIAVTGERISNNSAVLVGVVAGAFFAGPIAALVVAGVGGPIMYLFHRHMQASEHQLQVGQKETKAATRDLAKTLDSTTTEHGLTSIIGLGVEQEVNETAQAVFESKLTSLEGTVNNGHKKRIKAWVAGSLTTLGFMLAGAAHGTPFANLAIAIAACQAVGNIIGTTGQDLSALRHSLKQVNTIKEIEAVSQEFLDHWGGKEQWQSNKGPAIELDSVHMHRLGKSESSNLHLTMRAGEVTALIGPNGSGKSSIIQLLNSNRIEKSGEVKFDGVNRRHYSPDSIKERTIFISNESDGVFPHLLRRFYGVRKNKQTKNTVDNENEKRAVEYLANLGLDPNVARELITNPTQASLVSSGQGDRTSLLALDPEMTGNKKLALFDEVDANLDYEGKLTVAYSLRELADRGMTVVTATHSVDQILAADKVIKLGRRGTVLFEGRPTEILLPDVPFEEYSSAVCSTLAQQWAFRSFSNEKIEELFRIRDAERRSATVDKKAPPQTTPLLPAGNIQSVPGGTTIDPSPGPCLI